MLLRARSGKDTTRCAAGAGAGARGPSLSSQSGNPPARTLPPHPPPAASAAVRLSSPSRPGCQRLRRLGRHAPWARARPPSGAARRCALPGRRGASPARFSAQATACGQLLGRFSLCSPRPPSLTSLVPRPAVPPGVGLDLPNLAPV